MRVVLIEPVGATANITGRGLLMPRVPTLGSDPRRLQETKVIELARELARRGHRVTAMVGDVFLDGGECTTPDGVQVVPIGTVLRVPFHPGLIPATPALLRHPALERADIIQVGEFHQPSAFFASLAASRTDVPVLIWQETFRRMRFPGSLYQRSYESTVGRYVRARARGFIPRTTKARNYLQELGVAAGRIGPWIPTGIDVDAFAPRRPATTPDAFGWSDDVRVLLVVARLFPTKGIDIAIRALRWLLRRHPRVGLLVRGSGPAEPALRRLTADLKVGGAVRFLGRCSREEMVGLYNLADVVLCTSRMDLMPFSLMEAGSCGRPCVSTDVGAIRDIVIDGETGIVVRDIGVESIGSALASLLEDEGRRAAMGAAARDRIASVFSFPVVAERFLEVYRDVAG